MTNNHLLFVLFVCQNFGIFRLFHKIWISWFKPDWASIHFVSLNLANTKRSLHERMKFFSIKDFFSKCDQIRRKLRIWSHLLRKSLIENFIFCAVSWQQREESMCRGAAWLFVFSIKTFTAQKNEVISI